MLQLMVPGQQHWSPTPASLRTQECRWLVAKLRKLAVHTEQAIIMLLPTAVPHPMRVWLSTLLRCQTMETTIMWKFMTGTSLRVRVWADFMAMRLLCFTRRPILSRFCSAAMRQITVRGAQAFRRFAPK